VPFSLAERSFTGLAELSGSTAVAHPLSGAGLTDWQLMAGLQTPLAGAEVALIAGGGLSQGVGVPAARLAVRVSYQTEAPDRDGDGVPDSADACPDVAEDYNGYADLDGCPDADDKTTLDKVAAKSCPGAPGCDADRDDDGIPDAQDRCPTVPEDRNGVRDEDGCPDADADRDGVPDMQDRCPAEPETINGVDDADGCPDAGPGATRYVQNVGIEIHETIQFEVGRAVIKPASYPVLDQVALQLLAHDEVLRTRIGGHTDSAGAAETNLRLSQARADAVRQYLIERGVAPPRLEAIGYGETQPIADNATADGRSKNRRVEFVILQSKPRP
jgi:outer membrane protein OmpA-like peptidoglycan-associated protein